MSPIITLREINIDSSKRLIKTYLLGGVFPFLGGGPIHGLQGNRLFLESIHGNGRKLTANERGILQSLEGRIRWNYNAQKVHDPPTPHPRREIMACPLLSN